MVAEELKKRSGGPGGRGAVGRIETVIDGSEMEGGGVSGGTAASALNLMGDSKAMAVANDPYVCFPPGEAEERRAARSGPVPKQSTTGGDDDDAFFFIE